jgi:hypothetical protein
MRIGLTLSFVLCLLGNTAAWGVSAADLLNPRQFGAVGNGVSDDTAAFQAAIYGSIDVPDNRSIRCLPGAILLNPTRAGGNQTLWWRGTENGTLSDCTLEGTNTGSPPGYDKEREFNFLVLVSAVGGKGGHIVIKHNVFKDGWGNSELQLYGNDDSGPVHNVIVFDNEFSNCGYYGVALVSAIYSYVGYNRATDCSIGQEPDDSGQTLQGNIFERNYLKRVHGTGYTDVPMFLTGGQVLKFDFSRTRVINNVCDGAQLKESTAGPRAIYANNRCINGCLAR